MKTSIPSVNPPRNRRASGFTLVEVTLAIGVVAFAFVSIFSLLPMSLVMAREAMAKTHTARISQSLLAEVQQTPFEYLQTAVLGRVTYYDGEAQRIDTLAAGAPPPANFVYSATVLDPGTHSTHNARTSGLGLSADRTRTLAVRIAINRKVTTTGAPSLNEKQLAFLVSDVQM